MYRPTHISSSAPTVNDDISDGFMNGNFWLHTATDYIYLLEDSTVGAASWVNVYTGTGWGVWDSWSPSYNWVGATPAVASTVAEYCTVGDTVYFTLQIDGTNNGIANVTDMSATLPLTVIDNNSYVPVEGFSIVNGSYIKGHLAVIDSRSDPRKLYHVSFFPIPPTETFTLYYSGFYETE